MRSKKQLPNLLRMMPLRAERLKVDQIDTWQELFNDNVIVRKVWKRKVVKWGTIKISCPDNYFPIEIGELYLRNKMHLVNDRKNISCTFYRNTSDPYCNPLVSIAYVKYNFPKKTKKVVLREYLKVDPLTLNYRNLLDFFSKSNDSKFRFLIGKKGTGKTFNTLLALNGALKNVDVSVVSFDRGYDVQSQGAIFKDQFPNIKPCYISFDLSTKRVYIKPVKTFAKKAQFDIEKCCFNSFEKYVKWANLIVWDEIHYLLEYIIENNLSVKPFVDLLGKVMKRKVKILLISEEPLFHYATILKNRKLDNILVKFGLYPRFSYSGEEINFVALREIYPFTLWQLFFMNDHYKLGFPDLMICLLDDLKITVRGLIKLLKLVNWQPTLENLYNFFGGASESFDVWEQVNGLACSDLLHKRVFFYKKDSFFIYGDDEINEEKLKLVKFVDKLKGLLEKLLK